MLVKMQCAADWLVVIVASRLFFLVQIFSLSLSEQASVAMKKIRSTVNLGTRTYTDLQYTYTYTYHLRIGIV